MVSKTGMLSLVKAFRWNDVDAGLKENPDLLAFRDERGRNWLHVCCATKAPAPKVKDSIRTAEVLLAHGLAVDREASPRGRGRRRRSGTPSPAAEISPSPSIS